MKFSHRTLISSLWLMIITITMIPSSTEDSVNNVYNLSYFPVRESTGVYDPMRNVTVYPEGAIWDAELIQRVVTLAIIMLATLVGNTIILIVLSRSRYRKRSSRVNIFILNLAIGDLLVCLITMTSELLFEVFGEWVLGAIACKAIVYGQVVTLASTTFILTTMSYDRFQAICSPLRSTGGVKQAKKMIAASWFLASIFAIPQLFIFVQIQNGITETGRIRYECVSKGYTEPWQRKFYFSYLTCYILIIPAICISYCYINVLRTVWAAGQENSRTVPMNEHGLSVDGMQSIRLRRFFNAASTIPRAKIKTLKLTVCIISSFIVCWTPYFIVHNIRIFSNYTIKVPRAVIIGAETFALLNSALNPIFYGYFNVRVRKGFIEIVHKKKDITRNMVCNGGLAGATYYSSTMFQHVQDRTTQERVLEMSECGTYRIRISPRQNNKNAHFSSPDSRLLQQECYCQQCYSDVAL